MIEQQYFTSVRATDAPRARRGAAMMSTVIVFTALVGVVYATTLMSATDLKQSRAVMDEVRVEHLAESGLELGIHFLNDAAKKTSVQDPIAGLNQLFVTAGADSLTVIDGQPLTVGNAQVGAVSVRLTRESVSADTIRVTIEATGYVPDAPQNLAPNQRLHAWNAVAMSAEYSTEPSSVFDNGYFINNWGWFYGNTIYCNGNARSNGQFDAAGYQPYVGGQPVYDGASWDGVSATLTGYRDDNEDGLLDGGDGGVFSGWDIVAAQNVRGPGGLAKNQHDFQDQVPMPNLTDLTLYEDLATAQGSSIEVAGVTQCDGICGDDVGESKNLYLEGTILSPIVLDGPVVVQGDVIISGYVTGQGSIFAGGNVYVPKSIVYVDPPNTERPADNTQAETEQWLSDNWNKDFLGLFANENIVVGDHTHNTWRHYVGNWMGSSMNKSEEDAGEDGIPNTFDGRDGIHGTSDDDVLEDDGVFTAEYYSAQDALLGLIPTGYSVGDVIPGSGEDIDGDGQYDNTTTLADFAISAPLDPSYWEGNMPLTGIARYQDIASMYAARLDGIFYTNHAFTYVVFGSTDAVINGAVISRNEAIVYGTPNANINYDARLLGGGNGFAGNLLPRVLGSPVFERWRQLDEDPNSSVAHP